MKFEKTSKPIETKKRGEYKQLILDFLASEIDIAVITETTKKPTVVVSGLCNSAKYNKLPVEVIMRRGKVYLKRNKQEQIRKVFRDL